MEINYFSDYACPYCYIGETNLKKALKELNIDAEVLMRSFELDPNADKEIDEPVVERFSKKYGISEEEGLKRVQSISDMAAESGVPFDYSKVRPSNTFDAHRLTKYAQSISPETADKLSEKLFELYFVEQGRISDEEELVKCAVDVGLDETQVREVLETDAFADQVRTDEMIASELSIHAVPFFIINGEYGIPGALPVEQMVEILETL